MESTLKELRESFAYCGVTTINETRENFKPSEHIFMPGLDDPDVDIVCIGGHFKEHFLKKDFELEPSQKREIFAYSTITLDSDGGEMSCKELWLPENAISISELYSLLFAQKDGDDFGDLLISGIRNVFPVYDVKGEVCVVTLYYKHGWHLISRSVMDTDNSKYAGYPIKLFLAQKM